LNKAAAAEAAKLGVNLTVLSAEMDAQKQAAQMDTCIAQKVQGVIVVAADAKAIVPPIKKAYDAGIKVLIENAPVDSSADPYTIGFAGPGDYQMAQLAGKMAADYLTNGGNVAVIEGTAGYGPTIARLGGFTDYLKAYPNIKIIDAQFADWSRQKAIQISADQLTRFGSQINLFYTMDDDMAIGVAQSIQAANSSAKIVSLTAFPDSCPLIASGMIIGTAIQSGAADATISVDTMVRALNGETVPRQNYMDTPILTKANLDQCPKA
jgi:ABC-type sugar transport system substrate-binding protein